MILEDEFEKNLENFDRNISQENLLRGMSHK